MRTLTVLALALCLLAVCPPDASACGYGASAFVSSYSFYPAVPLVAYYMPACVPAPVPPPAQVNAAPAAAPAMPYADPGPVAAGTYGVAPLAATGGYTAYAGTTLGFRVPLYYNSFGFHAYNVGTGAFVRVNHGAFTNVVRVRGFNAGAFASAGVNQQVVVAAGGRFRGGQTILAQQGGGFGQQATIQGGRGFGRRGGQALVAQQGGGGFQQQTVINQQRRGLLGRRSSTTIVQQSSGGGFGGQQQAVIRGRR